MLGKFRFLSATAGIDKNLMDQESGTAMNPISANLIVIGGGSAGMASARRAAKYTKTVILIEHQQRLGGLKSQISFSVKLSFFRYLR